MTWKNYLHGDEENPGLLHNLSKRVRVLKILRNYIFLMGDILGNQENSNNKTFWLLTSKTLSVVAFQWAMRPSNSEVELRRISDQPDIIRNPKVSDPIRSDYHLEKQLSDIRSDPKILKFSKSAIQSDPIILKKLEIRTPIRSDDFEKNEIRNPIRSENFENFANPKSDLIWKIKKRKFGSRSYPKIIFKFRIPYISENLPKM